MPVAGKGRFWGGDLNGAAGQWRAEESHTPSLGLLGSLNCSGKPVGLGREGFEKAESSAKEMLSRREGIPPVLSGGCVPGWVARL